MDQLRKASNWVIGFMPPRKQQIREVSNEMKKATSEIFSHSRTFVRIAGLSGALAIILGAYGAHAFRRGSATEEQKLAFETGNRYHLINSVALLAVPLTNRPQLVGSLLLGGMALFSGGCYGYALFDSQTLRKVTPIGGMLLILAWASMVL